MVGLNSTQMSFEVTMTFVCHEQDIVVVSGAHFWGLQAPMVEGDVNGRGGDVQNTWEKKEEGTEGAGRGRETEAQGG